MLILFFFLSGSAPRPAGGYPGSAPPQGGYPGSAPPQGGYPGSAPPQGGYPGSAPPQGGYPGKNINSKFQVDYHCIGIYCMCFVPKVRL